MELKDIIHSIYPLKPEDSQLIEALAEEIYVEKNQPLISIAKLSNYIYFQKDGICRIYYPREDKEVILGFTFASDVLLSLNAYVHQKPGYECIETLEASRLYRISIPDLFALYNTNTQVANWGRKLAELEALKIEERLMLRLFKSATESYQELLERAPKMIQRIKLGYIASYLGISAVTLSRIRAGKK